jgi:hypothetical protein
MRSSKFVCLIGAGMLGSVAAGVPGVANAASPSLSGKYVLFQETICPATASSPGDVRILTATATFSSGTVNGSGYGVETGGVEQASGSHLVARQKAYTFDNKFTVSGTTLTFGSGSDTVTLHGTYGAAKFGIAQFADFIGLQSSAGVTGSGTDMCTLHITLTHF